MRKTTKGPKGNRKALSSIQPRRAGKEGLAAAEGHARSGWDAGEAEILESGLPVWSPRTVSLMMGE